MPKAQQLSKEAGRRRRIANNAKSRKSAKEANAAKIEITLESYTTQRVASATVSSTGVLGNLGKRHQMKISRGESLKATVVKHLRKINDPFYWVLILGIVVYLIYDNGLDKAVKIVSIMYCSLVPTAMIVGLYLGYLSYGNITQTIAKLREIKKMMIVEALLMVIGIIAFILWVPSNWQKGILVLYAMTFGVLGVVEVGRRIWKRE